MKLPDVFGYLREGFSGRQSGEMSEWGNVAILDDIHAKSGAVRRQVNDLFDEDAVVDSGEFTLEQGVIREMKESFPKMVEVLLSEGVPQSHIPPWEVIACSITPEFLRAALRLKKRLKYKNEATYLLAPPKVELERNPFLRMQLYKHRNNPALSRWRFALAEGGNSFQPKSVVKEYYRTNSMSNEYLKDYDSTGDDVMSDPVMYAMMVFQMLHQDRTMDNKFCTILNARELYKDAFADVQAGFMRGRSLVINQRPTTMDVRLRGIAQAPVLTLEEIRRLKR